ncbi:hypothetical protein LAZ67_14001771 [Cordylochernes scorpioides]|uniref:RNA-directed DNA polymerase n=1 Tax=Cordylochernes scorpioides TaxID=51811 RepID=A0ABY6L747_9ARAC|nr:hypothetical protein LAZ67_14001771 [Cordylochernes scorpioides]
MTRLISAQYYWQGMSKDIAQKVKTSPTCQLTKPPMGPTYGELGKPIVFKRVSQDGSPKRLLTDRAPAFISPRFRSFLLNRSIHPLLTTSNNPHANGLCQSLNATLTGKFRLLHLENPKVVWTKLVKRVTSIYNNTPHSTTGFPPIYLMFGVLPPEHSDHTTPYPAIDRARKIAHTRTENKNLRDKYIYDQRHKQPHFEVGDLVTDPEWKDKIITGDETWVYVYDPETKPQSAEWRVQGHDNHVSRLKLKKLRTPVRAMFTKTFNKLEMDIKKDDVEKIHRRLQTHHEKPLISNMKMEEALLRESASEGIFTGEYESVCECEYNFEYLRLLVYQDNRRKQRQLKVGEIVLVEVENRKQINWSLGEITEVFPRTYNVRRLVEVKTKSRVMKSAVQQLFPLELLSEDLEQGDGGHKPAEDEIIREKYVAGEARDRVFSGERQVRPDWVRGGAISNRRSVRGADRFASRKLAEGIGGKYGLDNFLIRGFRLHVEEADFWEELPLFLDLELVVQKRPDVLGQSVGNADSFEDVLWVTLRVICNKHDVSRRFLSIECPFVHGRLGGAKRCRLDWNQLFGPLSGRFDASGCFLLAGAGASFLEAGAATGTEAGAEVAGLMGLV